MRDVIRGMTREKLHSGIKNMLMEHRTNLLCDDWELINEECRDDILGDLKANNKTKAADRLIDYFDNNHTGEELLHFCDFLTKEAKDGGRNPKLLKLAKSIKEAVHDVSSGPSGICYNIYNIYVFIIVVFPKQTNSSNSTLSFVNWCNITEQ